MSEHIWLVEVQYMNLNLFSHKIPLCVCVCVCFNNCTLRLPNENWALKFLFFRNITLFWSIYWGSAPFTLNSSIHITRWVSLCMQSDGTWCWKDKITAYLQVCLLYGLQIWQNYVILTELKYFRH
jgi:hypothetical protein